MIDDLDQKMFDQLDEIIDELEIKKIAVVLCKRPGDVPLILVGGGYEIVSDGQGKFDLWKDGREMVRTGMTVSTVVDLFVFLDKKKK